MIENCRLYKLTTKNDTKVTCSKVTTKYHYNYTNRSVWFVTKNTMIKILNHQGRSSFWLVIQTKSKSHSQVGSFSTREPSTVKCHHLATVWWGLGELSFYGRIQHREHKDGGRRHHLHVHVGGAFPGVVVIQRHHPARGQWLLPPAPSVSLCKSRGSQATRYSGDRSVYQSPLTSLKLWPVPHSHTVPYFRLVWSKLLGLFMVSSLPHWILLLLQPL